MRLLSEAGLAPERFQRRHGIDLGEFFARCLRSNQARKFETAAPSRTWAACVPAISVAFLTDFISVIGSAPRVTRARIADQPGNGVRAGRGIDAHGCFADPCLQIAVERARLAHNWRASRDSRVSGRGLRPSI